MNILIIGDFHESTVKRIRACFPEDWDLIFADSKASDIPLEAADVIIPEHIRVDAALLDRAPRLRLVQTGAGFDNIDIEGCSRRGIVVCNAAGVNANAVAEHTLALLLGWYKNIPYLDSFMKSGQAENGLSYSGAELRGKTAGIIGLGATGLRVAALCRVFGMKVIGCGRRPKESEGIQNASLDVLLADSDIVSLHVPSTPETYHMIDRRSFSLMKSNALLVNTSRGAVIDEPALIEALKEHRIAGACLDVFESEPLSADSGLRTLPNVILTPHTGGFPDGKGFHKARYEFFAENIRRFQNGTAPYNMLNSPVI